MRELLVADAGAEVAHGQVQRAAGLARERHHRRLRSADAVAQRVVDQVAQQQAHAHRVSRHGAERVVELQHQPGIGELRRDELAHQRAQVHLLGLQRGVPAGQAFAFQQIGDQVAHLRQVAQQRVAVLALGHQLGIHACARERAAQLVADRQQQRTLRVEHALQAARHLVDALGQLAELVAPRGCNGLPEIARASCAATRAASFRRGIAA